MEEETLQRIVEEQQPGEAGGECLKSNEPFTTIFPLVGCLSQERFYRFLEKPAFVFISGKSKSAKMAVVRLSRPHTLSRSPPVL